MRDTSKDRNAWFSKWLEIHSGGDLPLKLSANDEGERVEDKKARVENIVYR